LKSLENQDFSNDFEILIIEDGSTIRSNCIVDKYKNRLNVKYFFKENTGAGISRNFGMQKASGNYFIILDSDVIVPIHYLSEVKKGLKNNFTDAFGGPDAAHVSFTPLQQAINYSMTSILTTGGIRGKKRAVGKFQPRSFNLGLSKIAFEMTQGFSKMKIGEDVDLTFRLWERGVETQLLERAFVYHKRRSTLGQFFKQTYGFGTARPILNKKYPETAKLTYWFPSFFIFGFIAGIIAALFGYSQILNLWCLYLLLVFLDAMIKHRNLKIALLCIAASYTQFLGYGLGYLKSQFSFKMKRSH
jgi:glycosyltransferase involved in cell wall biosynthesis